MRDGEVRPELNPDGRGESFGFTMTGNICLRLRQGIDGLVGARAELKTPLMEEQGYEIKPAHRR